ncbi:hypothetical protein [Mucilaginibacter sp.]|uniref:hypothetical protein n=1 Tax=Mucilaginibacter sp. TaxID=1882438 RepID=UPI0026289940|nr:hypothetical protein [Mucilaginibacter sp.]MDB4925884.1 hypothetical protein [Mucilaginibacter sp.]
MSPNPKIVIVIISTIILALTFRQDFIKNKKITIYKVFLFTLFLLIVGYGIVDVIKTVHDSSKDKQDILDAINKKPKDSHDEFGPLQEKQADIQKSLDDLKGNWLPKQSTTRPYAKLRFALTDTPNPTLIKTNNADSLVEKYRISNYGTGAAYDLVLSAFCVGIVNGEIVPQPEVKELKANKTVVIYPNKGEMLPGFANLKVPKIKADSLFWCFKLDFNDSTKKRKSFVKIFKINFNTLEYIETDEMLYNNIEAFLLKNKYWKLPLKQ